MARERGTFNFSANLEVKKQGALDSRLVVQTFAELFLSATWADSDNKVWLYDGMIVSVVADQTGKNGVYKLNNKDAYTSESSWTRIDSETVIVDNLTTESSTSALSAKQGKALKSSIDSHTGNSDIHVTADDKTKLEGIEDGAQVNTVTGVKGSSESTYRTGNINITKANVGLGNVTNESKATMFTSAALTGTPTAPTAASGTNTTQIATTAFVQSAIDTKIAAADAMIYKGTVDAADDLPSTTAKTGWTYKVATAGTYAGQECEVGDMIICLTDGSSSTAATWSVVQTNVDGAVTGPDSSVNNRVATFNGTTGKVIKDSGYTIAASVPSGAKFTDTTYTAGDGVALSGTEFSHADTSTLSGAYGPTANVTGSEGKTIVVPQITVDGYGHVTAVTNRTYTSKDTTYSAATTSAAGLMSATDKTKLDGIDEGANAYTHPSYTEKSSGLYKVTVDDQGHVSATEAVSKSDITALGIPGSDTNTTYTFSGGTNKFTVTPSGGTAQEVTVTPSISKNVTYTGTLTDEHVAAFEGTTGTIKDSGFTIAKSVPSNAVFTDTNTKVTSVGNHYTPAADESSELSADASSTTSATWGSTDLVTGVNIQRDAAGHVTGVTVDSIQMPSNPNTNTTYTFSGGTNKFTVTPSGGSAQEVTITPSISKNVTYTGTLVDEQVATFEGTTGTIKASGFTIGKSVPSNAVFTDTNTKVTSVGNHYTPSGGTTTSASEGTLTDITNSSSGVQVVTGVTKDAAGHVTGVTSVALKSVNTDTHYTTGIVAGGSGATSNASTTNPYVAVKDNSTYRSQVRLVGSGATTVTSDASGNITISSTDTNTTYSTMGPATSSAAGTSGLVPAPAAGKQSSYLRGDGTWATPTNTTYSAEKGITLASGKFGHSNAAITAGTAGTSSATSGSTLAVPYVTYDAYGHITAAGTHTHTISGFLTSHQTIKQDGVTGATANRYAACSTAAGTAAKTASVTAGTFNLEAGARVTVKFANANTAGTPTLNINSKGAKNIFHKGAQITTGSNKSLLAGAVDFIYDGTQWHLVGNYIDTNTTYSAATTSANGLMTSAMVTKLNGIATGATANTGTVTSVATGAGLTGGSITTSGTIKCKLKSETASTLDSAAMGSTASRQYAVGVDKSGYLSVNVPWTDNNTWRSISDSVSSTSSDVSASSKAVKTAYDLAASKTSNTGTVTSVTLTQGTGISIGSSGTAITTSGTRTISLATVLSAAADAGPTAAVTGSHGTTVAIPRISVDTYGRVTALSSYNLTCQNTTYSVATASANGLMAAADKSLSNFLQGVGTATTLASLDASKSTIYATLSSATSISLSGTLSAGRSITVICMPSATFTQPIPNSGYWMSMDGSSLSVTSGKAFEINIYCYKTDYYSVSCKTAK